MKFSPTAVVVGTVSIVRICFGEDKQTKVQIFTICPTIQRFTFDASPHHQLTSTTGIKLTTNIINAKF